MPKEREWFRKGGWREAWHKIRPVCYFSQRFSLSCFQDTQGCIAQWGAVSAAKGHRGGWELRVCTARFESPSGSPVLSLYLCSLVLGEAGAQLLRLSSCVQEELKGEWQAAGAVTVYTAEELLKIHCWMFLTTAVVFPRTVLLISSYVVMMSFAKDGQRLLKSDDSLALSWTGLHWQPFLVLCGRWFVMEKVTSHEHRS